MRTRLTLSSITITIFLLSGFALHLSAQQKKLTLSALSQNQIVNGFKAEAIYLNDANEPMGGRFVHQATGFTLDLLQIESVPQAFIWVNTFPVSDKGEPHTQEHLLITKGNKGHDINTREGMSLAQSNAFTSQLHTVYDFNTAAGGEVFYDLFERFLDALLYPDYTDEEVSREVRNWGITQNPDSTLRLEEKGSVYNEMSTTMNNPYALLYDSIGRLLYGNNHPISLNAGGLPAGIRVLNAADIHKFHDEHYFLANMGAITSLPGTMQLDSVLNRMNNILNELNKQNTNHASHVAITLPLPQPAAAKQISIIDYPSENEQEPGTMLFAYPADLNLSATEDVLLGNFLSVFAGDATTNLYKLFVDSKTRIKDFDAQSVYGYADDKQGQPIYFGLDGIKTENLTKEKAELAREQIKNELNKIASYKDHSPELIAFNKRYENSLISLTRFYTKFVNTPPKFGFRNTFDAWYSQIQEMNKIPGFRKSVVLKPQLDSVHQLLSSGTNIWKKYLQEWNLTTAIPYVVVSKANPSLITKAETERKERSAAEVTRLKSLYNMQDDQSAILRYKAIYDSNTTALEKAEQAHIIKFIDNPPLTLDDQLIYKQETLNGNVHMLASVFNNMTSVTTGIALNLNSVPQNKLVYLAIMPQLLRGTGIIKNGKAISYEDMSQMLQQQILSLESYYSTSSITGRAELVVKGAGNNVAEGERAIEWMNDVLKQPNWTKENLPRIRDLVEQELSGIRKTMQNPEEYWVTDPATAYFSQDKPLLLATSSFLTRALNIFRLKWMLKDAGTSSDSAAIQTFLSSIANAQGDREELSKLLSVINSKDAMSSDSAGINKQYADAFNQLPVSAKQLAKDAAEDLEQMLNDIPYNSLHTDWNYLCKTMQQGLAQTPEKTLADLNALRKSLLNTNNARLFIIGSQSTEDKLTADINKMLSDFDKTSATQQQYSSTKMIDERVKQRMNATETPVFVGLMNPNSPTGVFINSAPLTTYRDTTKEQLQKFLSAELYAGGGKQSVYTKSTGAGLSYSTGVGASPASGRFQYYAERTPELPQTLRFVINEIKNAPVDSGAVDYVVSLAVRGNRSASDYEVRGEAMAADLTDSITPEVVKTFRQSILQLRKEPDFLNAIYHYKDSVYQKILPGYGTPSKDVEGAINFVIGPEKQMKAYEAYLKSVEGENTTLYRLYPRDYWMADAGN